MDVAGRLESSVVACWLLSHFRQPDFCSSVEILPTGCQHVVPQTTRSNRIDVALVAFVLESSNRWCCPTSGNQTVEVFLMLGRAAYLHSLTGFSDWGFIWTSEFCASLVYSLCSSVICTGKYFVDKNEI